ncbi:MAG: DUF4430 domain-containing protein [bacterium]
MSKNKKIILIVIISLSILDLLLYFSTATYKNSTVPLPQNTTITTAILEINGISYENSFPSQTTVYDFMSQLQSDGKITFKDKTYTGIGKLIEEINGIKGGGGKFWIYYVNGKKAEIGVSNYKINNGDIVSWKYEKGY